MTSKTFRFILVISLLVVVTASITSCGYVGPKNIYGLTNEDYQLLYNADPMFNHQIDYLLDIETSLQGQTITINLEGDGGFLINEAEMMPGVILAMTGTAENSLGKSMNLSADLRMVDGVLYMKAENLDTGETEGWQKLDIMQAILDMAGVDFEEAEIPEAGWETTIDDMADMGLGKYTTITLVGEEEIGGVATKHFMLDVDPTAFLQSEEFAESIMSSLNMGAGAVDNQEIGVTAEELQTLVPMLKMLIPMIFTKLDLKVEQYVGIDDGRVRRTVTAFDMEINLSSFGAMAADPSAFAEPITFSLFLDTHYRNFEESFEIEVPEDATSIPVDELLNPLGQ